MYVVRPQKLFEGLNKFQGRESAKCGFEATNVSPFLTIILKDPLKLERFGLRSWLWMFFKYLAFLTGVQVVFAEIQSSGD